MSNPNKPFAQSCEENKDPILQVIEPLFAPLRSVLEIGSGTGQHAVYFAGKMPHLTWQTSDRAEAHAGIEAWIRDEAASNVLSPMDLDVTGGWPRRRYDAVFSANTAHIMSRDEVASMFSGLNDVLAPGGFFVLYGPFNYGGHYSSDSNARFDEWLARHHPHGGIKNFEDLDGLARAAGLSLFEDHVMPANNRILVWRLASG